MEFASSHVYYYDQSDEEYVSEDEYEHGMTLSGDSSNDSDSDGDSPPRRRASAKKVVRVDSSAAAPSVPSPPPPPAASKPSGLFGKLKKAWTGASASRSASHASPKKYKKKSHWRRPLPASREACYDNVYEADDIPSKRKWRRADTNVVSVKFETLTAPSNMHTGDPTYCIKCKGVLSHLSKLTSDGPDSVWTCEFCGEGNLVELVPEELPKAEDTTYMLQPAPLTTASGRSGTDESLVIFCVDVSGSMCVTTEVPGKVNFRGDRTSKLQSLNTEHEDQYMPGQRRNVTYVSRLQAVQAAVDHQLSEMQKSHPSRRIGLIVFSNEVKVIGDGSTEPSHFAGDKLNNQEELVKIGSSVSLPKPIQESRKVLGDKLFDLEEGGATALGPALLVSVSMACQVPGSKVIICTDGMANVGLGSLDNLKTDEDLQKSSAFYEEVSAMAVESGVSISMITIKGTDCKLVELGKVADETRGQVNIVDPLKLTQEFGSILADPIIATKVQATLLLHRGLYIRNEESKDSKVTRTIGNVTKETEITFEYGVKPSARKQKVQKEAPLVEVDLEKSSASLEPSAMTTEPSAAADDKMEPTPETTTKMEVSTENNTNNTASSSTEPAPGSSTEPAPGSSTEPTPGSSSDAASAGSSEVTEELKELPFQLQITYTDLDGAEAMRVITQVKPLTTDRNVAEQYINVGVLGVHTAQTSAQLALQGEYTPSRMNAFMNQRLVSRFARRQGTEEAHDTYAGFYDNVAPLEKEIKTIQHTERSTHGATHSDDEDMCCEPRAASRKSYSEPMQQPRQNFKSRLLSKKPWSTDSPKGNFRRRECSDTSAEVIYQTNAISSKAFAKKH